MEREHMVVLSTASGRDEAGKIAAALVEESLAACVNIVPGCTSVYRWEGRIVTDDEVLLVIKTSRAKFDALATRLTRLHSYDVPEVVGIPMDAVSGPYRRFLEDSLGG